jgi:hypothetical protein
VAAGLKQAHEGHPLHSHTHDKAQLLYPQRSDVEGSSELTHLPQAACHRCGRPQGL